MSDRSRCGAVLVFRTLAQSSRHFGHVRSLSLWPDKIPVHGLYERYLCKTSEKSLVKISEILRGGLSCRELETGFCVEIPLTEILRGDFWSRPCAEIVYRDRLQWRSCQEFSNRELVPRSCQAMSWRDPGQGPCEGSRDLAKRSLIASLNTGLA